MDYKISNFHSLWFTGYPSSGKTTLAKLLKIKLESYKIPVLILDGDELRRNYFTGLGYNKLDRIYSTKFAISLVKLLMQLNVIVIVSGNHASTQQRKLAKQKIKKRYSEIWISSPLNICKKRDVKNLFKKAQKNKIKNLVGHDVKFEVPKNYDLKIDSTKNKDECVNRLFLFLLKKKFLIKD